MLYRRQTGKPHPEDREHVTPPTALLYLWDWFWEVAQGRPVGPEGIQMPIPPSEVYAWAQLGGHQLRAWELKALRGLDNAYLRVAAERI